MKVLLRNPRREVAFEGPQRVTALLARLGLHRDAVLVISDGDLVPGDALLPEDAEVEIRPVISGGAA